MPVITQKFLGSCDFAEAIRENKIIVKNLIYEFAEFTKKNFNRPINAVLVILELLSKWLLRPSSPLTHPVTLQVLQTHVRIVYHSPSPEYIT